MPDEDPNGTSNGHRVLLSALRSGQPEITVPGYHLAAELVVAGPDGRGVHFRCTLEDGRPVAVDVLDRPTARIGAMDVALLLSIDEFAGLLRNRPVLDGLVAERRYRSNSVASLSYVHGLLGSMRLSVPEQHSVLRHVNSLMTSASASADDAGRGEPIT